METRSRLVTPRQVSVSEASRELGVSPETVRRWIKTGRLQGRRSIRPQGTVWSVTLPVITPRGVPPVTPVDDASDREQAHASSGEAWDPSPPVSGQVTIMATVRQQSDTIARLIVDLAEARVISDQRADRLFSQATVIAELREERGRLAGELELTAAEVLMAKVREGKLADDLAQLRADQARYTEILVRHASVTQRKAPAVGESLGSSIPASLTVALGIAAASIWLFFMLLVFRVL
jgi:transposase-like protein